MNNSPESTGNAPGNTDWENMARKAQERSREETDAQLMKALGITALQATPQNPSNEQESSRETARNLPDKAKHNNGFKKALDPKKALAIALLTLSTAAGAIAGVKSAKQPAPNPTAVETLTDDEADAGVDTSADIESMEAEQGIKQGYDQKGMWLSSNKPNAVAFASADEVREVCGDNPIEMVKYTGENQVESLSAYIPGLPAGVQKKFLPEFDGLSVAEVEKKLESMEPQSYDSALQRFKQAMDNATVHQETITGDFANAYMDTIDKAGPVTNENMKIVKCTTHEDGTSVSVFEWFDDEGNSLGTMTAKTGPKGCMQVVEELSSAVLEGLENIPNPEQPPTPILETEKPTPTPTPETEPSGSTPTPTPETEPPAPKNQAEANENSGASQGIVKPESQDRPVTEEPTSSPDQGYNSDTNTYNNTPADSSSNIGYEVSGDTGAAAPQPAPVTAPEAEVSVANNTAPAMVAGTQQGAAGEAGQPNNFDAGATEGKGEVAGNTQSADGSGNTIEDNLNNATGNGDFTPGF